MQLLTYHCSSAHFWKWWTHWQVVAEWLVLVFSFLLATISEFVYTDLRV